MRSGGVISSSSTSSGGVLEQTLTAEAASVLKHSLTLARRRGHAHLTPLHVAATLLSSRTSLFRRACLSSTTTPNSNNNPVQLQCRALELCFNVALNRLPTSSTPPLHQFYVPSLSNALIAALKRAQAHQRRGSIEQQQHQQQPLLAIKVELQSLVISILDDPSVSRVMREAGFSSTCVKNNLEQQHHNTSSSSSSSSLLNFHYNPCGGIFSSPSSPDHHHHHHQLPSSTFWHHNNNTDTKYFLPLEVQFHQNQCLPFLFNSPPKNTATSNFVKEEDVKLVLEVLLRNNINNNNNNSTKKRTSNTVVVGDSVALTEGLVMEVMRRFEKGQVPHHELKRTRFLKLFEFFVPVSLRVMSRQDVDKGLLELKKKLHLHDHQESVIIYTGDLKWTVDDDDDDDHRHIAINKYNPVDHLVEEIAGLVDGDDDKPKVWIMGIASYQTYMRCQMRKPPLEIQWSLQAVSVPSSAATTGLALTLNHRPPNTNYSTSFHESRIMFSSQDQSQSQSQSHQAVMETKPLFMLGSKDEQHNNSNKVMTSLCSECSSHFEKEAQRLQPLKSTPHKLPAWLLPHGTQHHQIMDDQLVELKKKWNRMCHSLHEARRNNASQFSQRPSLKRSYSSSSYPWWHAQSKDSNSIFFSDHQAPNPDLVPQFRRQQSCMIEFNLGGDETQKHDQQVVLEPSELGKEMKITLALGNSCLFSYNHELENVERGELCSVLKENVPWQSETIPSIVEAIIDSKSAITWLMIHGNDLIGKRRLACAVAESVLGSADMLIQLKRKRNENIGGKSQESEIGIITKALKSNKKSVVLVEDIDSMHTRFSKFLSDAFETGNFGGEVNREEANLGQAVFILTKEGGIRAHATDVKSKEPAVIQMTLDTTEAKTRGTDTNFECLSSDRKRKAVVTEWELPKKSKNLRTDAENKEFDNMNVGLDLNVMAKGDEEIGDENNSEENKPGEVSPISSDLTRETENGQNPSAFTESIENAFTFDRSPARDREMAEVFEGKMEKCFDEIICGDQNVVSFRVEERVLQEVCNGCGYFTNSLFEKWVKEVFEKALKKVRFSGKEKMGGLVNVRLCLGGGNLEEGLILEDGFMGSCLPNKIQLYYKD